jgi:hypothetical protein
MERARIFQLLASSRGGAAVHLRALAPGLVLSIWTSNPEDQDSDPGI